MSALRAVFVTMFVVVGMIVGYLVVSPAYHTLLEEMNSTVYAHSEAGSSARSHADDAYWIFYYGLGSIVVLGVLAAAAWLYMFMRRRYYSTEVVYG